MGDTVAEDLYDIDIPGYERSALGRTLLPHKAALPHQCLAKEMANTGVAEAVAAARGDWEPLLGQHPVVARSPAGTIVVPCALYLDGVSFINRDSALGVWLVNLATQKRHLLMALRKRSSCRCGCKTWCTLHTALSYVAWGLSALAEGRYPPCRHDGSSWAPTDPNHGLAGQGLGFCAAVVMVKGDWAEFTKTLGFPAWNAVTHPCFACHCSGGANGSMRQHAGSSPLALPWRPKTAEDYEGACQACEQRVVVTSAAQLERLAGTLMYDKRLKTGSHGRCLARHFPELGLRKGMRLEPSETCPDVGNVEHLNVPHAGLPLVFWDRSRETIARHRNPLFSRTLGLTIESLVADEMHTVFLGPMQDAVLAVFWRCIDANVYAVGAPLAWDVQVQLTVGRLRRELFEWYRAERQQHPEKPLYELQDLDVRTIWVVGRSGAAREGRRDWDSSEVRCRLGAPVPRATREGAGPDGRV